MGKSLFFKTKGGGIIDKRRYTRIKKEVELLVERVNLGSSDYTRSKNISASGVLFEHDRQFSINMIVKVRFLLPKTFDFFESFARVVRVELNPDDKTYEIGVEFIGLTDEEKDKLKYFIEG